VNHAIIAIIGDAACRLGRPRREPAGPVDVPDGPECATEPPPCRTPGRRGWRSFLINNPASRQPEPAAAPQPAIETAIRDRVTGAT